MTIDISTLQEIQEKLGPKRVKTPQQEVEQFDLRDLLQAANSHGTKKPSLMNIGWTRVVPKDACRCDIEKNKSKCSE